MHIYIHICYIDMHQFVHPLCAAVHSHKYRGCNLTVVRRTSDRYKHLRARPVPNMSKLVQHRTKHWFA